MNNEKTKEILRKVEHCALRDFYYHDPAHFAEVMLQYRMQFSISSTADVRNLSSQIHTCRSSLWQVLLNRRTGSGH